MVPDANVGDDGPMNTRSSKPAPGIAWIFVLGAAAGAAGFFGPIVFSPESNQGPLVGLFISGPAGAALGALLLAICALLKPPAPAQWRALYGIAMLAVVVTLFYVQPQPALRGRIFEATVTECAAPPAAKARALEDWRSRIAAVTWSQARAGWEQDMHKTLQEAPGVQFTAQISRRRSVFENRKPWNRGSLFASAWESPAEQLIFYEPNGTCAVRLPGSEVRGFLPYDLNGTISAPTDWPPRSIYSIIDASDYTAIPARFGKL